MKTEPLNYTADDFLRAHQLAAHVSWRRWPKWAILFSAGIWAAGFNFFVLSNGENQLLAAVASLFLGTLACALAFWLIEQVSAAFYARRALKAQPALQEEFTFTLQDDGLHETSAISTNLIKWAHLHGYAYGRGTWLFFPDRYRHFYYALPERVLSDDFANALTDSLEKAGVRRL